MNKRNSILLITGLTILTHLSYLSNGFVWLDHGDIERGRAILPLSQLLHAFFVRFGETGFYRPVVTIVLSLVYSIFGTWAPAFHFVSVASHVGVNLASFFFLQRFFNLSKLQAWIGALVVGIHPLSWFTVGAIPHLPDLLMTIFIQGALIFYIDSQNKTNSAPEKNRKQLCFLVTCLLAFFSKETALVLIPGLITIWEMTHKNFSVSKSIQRNKFFLFGLVMCFGSYFTLRTMAVPEIWRASGHSLSVSEAVGTRLSATLRTMGTLLSPITPAVSDATPVLGILHWSSIVAIMVILFITYIAIRYHSHPTVTRIALFFLVSLAPGLNILPLPRFWTTNYGYFTTTGMGALVGMLWLWSNKKKSPARKSVQIALASWLVISGITTAQAGARLQNDQTLFEREVQQDRNFKEGAFYLGNYYWERGTLIKAEEYFRISLTETPNVIAYLNHSSAMINYAGVLVDQQKTDEAAIVLQEVVNQATSENMLLARYNLAILYYEKNDFHKVVELLDGKITGWNKQEPWLLLLRAHISLGNEAEAKRVLFEAWPFLSPSVQKQLAPLLPKK